MINENSQPRCLRRSEPEFDEVVNYMTRITRDQKLMTEYPVTGDEIILI